MRTVSLAVLSMVAAPVLAAAQVFTPRVPTIQTFPSVNSIRPGVIAPLERDEDGNLPGPETITIYGLGYADIFFFSGLGALSVTWDGQPLAFGIVPGAPDTQIRATVPAEFLEKTGEEPRTAVVLATRSGTGRRFDSAPVEVTIGDVPSCDGEGPECGAALGTIPVVEILPTQIWYPSVTAPPGGLVLVRNHDIFAPHTFTSAANPGFTPDGRFNLHLAAAPAIDQPTTGYIRAPDGVSPFTRVPFFCALHTALMAPSVGELVIE